MLTQENTQTITEPLAYVKNYLCNMAQMRDQFQRGRWRESGTFKYVCPEDLVLAEGREFPFRKKPRGMRFGKIRECYANAGKIAVFSEEYTYCEGWAMSQLGMVCQHGWLGDAEGNAIELTWRQPGVCYYGVPFQTEYLRQYILQAERWGIFYNHTGHVKYLTGEHPVEQWKKKDLREPNGW